MVIKSFDVCNLHLARKAFHFSDFLNTSPNGNEAGADLAALQTDDEEGIAAAKNTDLNNRIKNFEVLQNKQPNPVEWQRVFNEQPVSEETDYSILSTIGEGLLTAGKIAAAILL